MVHVITDAGERFPSGRRSALGLTATALPHDHDGTEAALRCFVLRSSGFASDYVRQVEALLDPDPRVRDTDSHRVSQSAVA